MVKYMSCRTALARVAKLSCVFFIGLLMILPTVSVSANSEETLLETFSFSFPEFSKQTYQGIEYDVITIDSCELEGAIGEPMLPMYAAEFLIHYGYEVTDIEVTAVSTQIIGEDLEVLPAPNQYSFSTGEVIDEQVQSEPASGSGPWHTITGSHLFRGYELLYVNLYPIFLDNGDAVFASNLAVEITCSPSEVSENFRGLMQDREMVLSRITNAASMVSYPMMQPTPVNENYDMLIVTTEEFAESFLPLKQAHQARGLEV